MRYEVLSKNYIWLVYSTNMTFNRKKAATKLMKSADQDELLSEKEAEKEAKKAYPDVSKQNIVDEDLDKTSPEETGSKQMAQDVDDDISEEISDPSGDLKQASELAKKKLSEALDKPANATISIENAGNHWLAMVEVVEEEYLPGQNLKSMNDLLGVYEVHLSLAGKLLKWTRKNSYKRAEIK
jgi:hypothetical protein